MTPGSHSLIAGYTVAKSPAKEFAMNTTELEIPREIEERYEGQWIAWDTESKVVLASGDTMEDLVSATRDAVNAGRLIWYHHLIRPDAVLVGGMW